MIHAFTDERAAIFLDWWFSEVNTLTYTLTSSVKIKSVYLKQKKSLVGWYLFSYYII